jgi:shikimate kinase
VKFFLIGFMGAGKTTLGKYAGIQNGLQFIDLDQYIAQREGQDIRDIFQGKGEGAFRVIERKCLEEVCAIEGLDLIVSCGGGTPCFFDNMALMNRSGHTIYLDVGTAILTGRIRNSTAKRPLLDGIAGDLQALVHKMLMERAEFYSMAQTVVAEGDCNKKFVAALVRLEIEKLRSLPDAPGNGH